MAIAPRRNHNHIRVPLFNAETKHAKTKQNTRVDSRCLRVSVADPDASLIREKNGFETELQQ